MLFMIVCSASVVLESGLKAYWVGEMISLSRRCCMIWLLMMVSRKKKKIQKTILFPKKMMDCKKTAVFAVFESS